MAEKEEKAIGGNIDITGPKSVVSHDGSSADFYDVSQEKLLTRIGLNLESFKRAPGSTRWVRCGCGSASRLTNTPQWPHRAR